MECAMTSTRSQPVWLRMLSTRVRMSSAVTVFDCVVS